jgi:hypothetical protein
MKKLLILLVAIMLIPASFGFIGFGIPKIATVHEILDFWNESNGTVYLEEPYSLFLEVDNLTLNGSTIYDWSDLNSSESGSSNDTLQDVTDRGATTDNDITIDKGGLLNSALHLVGSVSSTIRSTATDTLQLRHNGINAITIQDNGESLFSGDITADAIIKSGATSDDVLLGDGTTTSLSGIGGGEIDSDFVIPAKEMTLIGSGTINDYPVFGSYIGFENYTGSSIYYTGGLPSPYFVNITNGTHEGLFMPVPIIADSPPVFKPTTSVTVAEELKNERASFTLYFVEEGALSIPSAGIYLGDHLDKIGNNALGGSDYQPILYYHNTTFLAGRMLWTDEEVPFGTIALGASGVGGTGGNNIVLNGFMAGDSTSSFTAFGDNRDVTSSVSIGHVSQTLYVENAVAVGRSASVEDDADGSVAIGYSAGVYNSTESVAIGRGSNIATGGIGNTAIGQFAKIDNDVENSTIIGVQTGNGLDKDNTFAHRILSDYTFGATYKEGFRIGSLSGESITMDGDDLYVADNVEADGFLVLGSNTESGLNAGDINASTIYYDTLVAKSPVFLCSEGTGWCEIKLPEYQTSLFVEFDDVFNPLQVVFAGTTYTINDFLNDVCTINAEAQGVCDEIAEKYIKLRTERLEEVALNNFVNSCTGKVEGNECVEYVESRVSYNVAVESVQVPVYEYVEVSKQRLNESLQVETYISKERGSIIGYEEEFKFAEGCNWDISKGYTCVQRNVLSTLN